MKKLFNISKARGPEGVSSRVFYVLVVLVLVVFCLFYMVGYDRPYADNPDFNAPLFTDVVLIVAFLLVAVAMAASVMSAVRAFRSRGRSNDNGVPAGRLRGGVAALLVVCMVVGFVLGSPESVDVNGTEFDNVFWLKAAGMFITTVAVLLAVAVAGVVAGITGFGRKYKDGKK